MHELLGLEPSTETLVVLIRGMVNHFQHLSDAPDQQEAQRLRLMITSHLDDGEFARLLYEKIGDLIGPVFTASLEQAVAAGDASRIGSEPLNLFWLAHHIVLMAALTRLPSVPCLTYGHAADLERQVCEFVLRGIGLNETAIASHLDREMSLVPGQSIAAESA
jgi:TetR/AcrR family transcriptional regulator, transcriptional repressor of aconitase